jgi:uncharacterized cupredoxin-like copper-binding protein
MSSAIRRVLILFTAGVLALMALTACAAPAPSSVDVTLDTYSIKLSSPTAKAGDVTFHVKNVAVDLVHEFVVFRTDLAPEKMPLNSEGIVDEKGEGVTHIDELENLATNGGMKDLTVTLTAGHYVLICNTAGHFKGGMHAELTVVP